MILYAALPCAMFFHCAICTVDGQSQSRTASRYVLCSLISFPRGPLPQVFGFSVSNLLSGDPHPQSLDLASARLADGVCVATGMLAMSKF